MSTNSNITIHEIALSEIEGIPTVRDLDLAERLGFRRPRVIRELIQRNIKEIEAFGPAPRRTAPISSGKGRVTGVEEYWLNEEQALLVASLSDAPQAPAVRSMLIKVFVAYRRGQLQPTQSAFPADLVEYIRRTDGISRMLSHKVTEMEKVLATIAGIVQPDHPVLIRHGKTAGQLLKAAGCQGVKGLSVWFGNRLEKLGALIDGNAHAEMGLTRARLFDPDKADLLLENGLRFSLQQKIAERKGQGTLRIIPG
jgi:hypothetical protein